MQNQYKTLILLILGVLAVFIARALLAANYEVPYTFQLFDTMTVIGGLIAIVKYHRFLEGRDTVIALAMGLIVGVGMLFATLFSPYPFLGIVRSNAGQALVRGGFTAIATLGGLAIMRQGGPVQFLAARGKWSNAGQSILVGLAIGLPFAVLNAFALSFTQGEAIAWQNPIAALLDALQPAVVEEIIYRFALWGLLWWLLRNSLPKQANWLTGILAMLIHNYTHFDDLILQSPVLALGMGAIMAVFWGLPPLILAGRRGLESAIAFHWIQDVARFLTGF